MFKRSALTKGLLLFTAPAMIAGVGMNVATSAEAASPTQITFWENWGSGPSQQSLQKSVAAFNASHPNIHVNMVFIPATAATGGDSVTAKLLTAVAAGNPPDVVLASRYGVAEYESAVTPLNSLAQKNHITASMYYPWAWQEAQYKGTLLGLPYDGTARALFYNKTLFKKAGLDPNKPPTTIAQLDSDAKKLTVTQNGKITQYGFVPWMGEGWLYTWGWAFGGDFLNNKTGMVTPDDPNIVRALTWEINFAKNYGEQNMLNFSTSTGSNANDPFLTGQLAMVVTGNWEIQNIAQYNPKLDYGISYIPTPSGKSFTTYVGGRSLVIPKGAKHLDASWEFVKWMCATPQGQSFKKITGEFPAMPSVAKQLYRTNPQEQIFLKVLPHGHHRPVILAGNMMWNELANVVDEVVHGQGTPEQVLKQVATDINNQIKMKNSQQQ